MLQTIVSASSDKGDIVMDPFCGSGSTLHAANDLNRRWIGIDNSVEAFHAILDRFFNGLKPMGDYVSKTDGMPKDGELFARRSNNSCAFDSSGASIFVL
jgi:adenine-specific DNA-methyltransferase